MFQQQNWGQQQNLPFDPTYINQQQLVAVQPGQPPVNIQVQTHPNLEPYVPFISSLLINEIQTAVQVNPNNLRIFMFNQMSRNFYNNQDYSELLQITCNWVLMHVMRVNGNVQPDQVAQQLVPQICQMRAAANCAQYQGLLGYIDQSMQLEAQNGFRAFQQTVGEISRFIQQLTRPQQTQSFGMGMQPSFGGGVNPGMSAGSTGLFNNNQQAQQTTTGTRFDNTGGGSNPYAQQLNEMRGGNKPASGGFGGQLNQGVQPRQPQSAAVVEEFGSGIPNRGFGAATTQPTSGNWSAMKTPDQTTQVEATVLTGEVKWKRSDQQPHHPAWNPKTQTIVYVEANGAILAVPTQKPHNAMNEPLDYDRHSIGRVPQGAPITPPKSTSLEDAVVSRELLPTDPIELVTNETISLDTHEVSAAISAGLEAFAKGVTRRDHAAYRSLRFIADPLYFRSDAVAEEVVKKLKEISDSRTLRRVQDILQQMTSPEELGVQIRLDKILTREVNDALAMNLGLVMRIDSFMQDYGDLDGYLRSKYGSRLADVLREHEIDMLSRAIELFDGEEAVNYANVLLEEIPEDQRVPGRILFLVKRVTFTHLSESAHELNLALKGSTASQLTEAGHPALYKLAQELFENATIKENSYSRHFFITTDGVKLSVDRGWLNKEAILIKLED